MSIYDRWARLDYSKTAHWWLGNVGTACGRDFRVDIRQADDAEMRVCRVCAEHPDATPFAPAGGEDEGGER